MLYQNTNANPKILERQNNIRYNTIKKVDNKINDGIIKRENTIIALLTMTDINVYPKIKMKLHQIHLN